ncbi:SGNH/GDSL hydrolase family protein [Aestuariivivens sp. NBU2969]|uniref:SGNH/GDSL hydrolase family protein n=1 Tax=Aestuariivivens sp. NBU2969 TaxID=2873267 RepID=UPI001CC086CD|nr:SGNH/GDSL hydrolase family protein [Aestuariivivens sp. NBU2969]
MLNKVNHGKIALVFLLALVLTVSGFSNKTLRILIIGDSISIGYTPFVKQRLNTKAFVEHNPGNAQHTGTGLKNIDKWIGEGHWDIIQFNWGLWDLCYRHPDSKVYGNRDKTKGTVTFSLETYASNLDTIVRKIKEKSSAKLIFVSTSYVPKEEVGRHAIDAKKYNKAAKAVMKKYGVMVIDIYKASKKIHNKYGIGTHDVHYTKQGYAKLGEIISDVLLNQIKSF